MEKFNFQYHNNHNKWYSFCIAQYLGGAGYFIYWMDHKQGGAYGSWESDEGGPSRENLR